MAQLEVENQMRMKPRLNWFDAFMMAFAFLPFAYLWAASSSEWKMHVPAAVDFVLYLIFIFGILGFPVASVLYFFWRVKSGEGKEIAYDSAFDTDAQARRSP